MTQRQVHLKRIMTCALTKKSPRDSRNKSQDTHICKLLLRKIFIIKEFYDPAIRCGIRLLDLGRLDAALILTGLKPAVSMSNQRNQ